MVLGGFHSAFVGLVTVRLVRAALKRGIGFFLHPSVWTVKESQWSAVCLRWVVLSGGCRSPA